MTKAPQDGSRAPVGRPPKLNREMIISAAQSINRDELTITRVAERLGVVRNAVAYYVDGRQELIALVVARDLAERLEPLEVPVNDWRAALRVVAQGLFDALSDEKALAVLTGSIPAFTVLRPVEDLLTSLLAAGFDEEMSARALSLLTQIVLSAARGRLELEANEGKHPLQSDLAHTLAEHPDDFPSFKRVVDSLWHLPVRPVFEVELLIAGLDALR